METLTLIRNQSSPTATLGQLFHNGKQICVTLELPWKDNQHDISCIPSGTYACIPHNSPKHPNTWEVTGVPDRSEILMHNANLASQLLGCIAPGDTYGTIDGQQAVLNSVLTMDKLRDILPDYFNLTIQE